MPTCFVIQPFNSKFDKKYRDVYKPALEKAGLDPYRVDQDPSTEGVMDSIEQADPRRDDLSRRHHDRQS